jgi:LacI family transcriptional regulator, galactose operon repressor
MYKIPKILLMIESSREYGRQLLRGISNYATLYGPWNFITSEPFYYGVSGTKKSILRRIEREDLDGIIMRESNEVEQIAQMCVPAVICTYTQKQFPGIISLVGDCEGAGKLAAKHLLELGLKYFAFCGLDNMYWSNERGTSFQKHILEAGFKVQFYRQPLLKQKRLWKFEQDIMIKWLNQLPKPIGLMTCTDDRSQDVIEACKAAGIRVPDEIAIIGVDNDEFLCGLSNPPLTSVALNATVAGYKAAEMLHRLIKGKKNTDTIITAEATHVAVRQSTNILAIDDTEAINAINFIRQNARRAIQVCDVVNSGSLSKRALQQRFKKFLGRTIYGEINRVRLDYISQLLLKSHKTISEIALELEFLSDEHIARYFKKGMGLTPHEFRRRFGYNL